jgi:hypothetical protein
MEMIDLTTSAGVAAATLIVIECLKQMFVSFELKQYAWYPASLNLATLVIAMCISMSTVFFTTVGIPDSLLQGVIAFLLAIGGYEPLVNVLRGLFHK